MIFRESAFARIRRQDGYVQKLGELHEFRRGLRPKDAGAGMNDGTRCAQQNLDDFK